MIKERSREELSSQLAFYQQQLTKVETDNKAKTEDLLAYRNEAEDEKSACQEQVQVCIVIIIIIIYIFLFLCI